MRISLIVTTYERPDALSAVLRSIERQSLPPDEIIVADDGSGPETADVIHNAAKRMNILHEWRKHDGFRAARMRNRALIRASGEYVVSIDGDILLHRHFVADHAVAARSGICFFGDRVWLCPEATRRAIEEEAYWPSLWDAGVRKRHHLLRLQCISRFLGITDRHRRAMSCNMAFWRDDAFKVNGFNEDFVGWGYEDRDFTERLSNRGIRCRALYGSALTCHLYHPCRKDTNFPVNYERLRKVRETGEVWCENGLVRKLPSLAAMTDERAK